jgi:hypothetical protein
MLSGAVLTLTLALVTAQGPRSGGAAKRNRIKAAPVPNATQRVEKRVAPPPRATEAQAAPANKRAEPTPADTTNSDRNSDRGETVSSGTEGQTTTKPAKTKVYTFGAMDVEGKLKTPQLLYFLNRVKLELEMSAPDHRSFMKELAKTADDPSL